MYVSYPNPPEDSKYVMSFDYAVESFPKPQVKSDVISIPLFENAQKEISF